MPRGVTFKRFSHNSAADLHSPTVKNYDSATSNQFHSFVVTRENGSLYYGFVLTYHRRVWETDVINYFRGQNVLYLANLSRKALLEINELSVSGHEKSKMVGDIRQNNEDSDGFTNEKESERAKSNDVNLASDATVDSDFPGVNYPNATPIDYYKCYYDSNSGTNKETISPLKMSDKKIEMTYSMEGVSETEANNLSKESIKEESFESDRDENNNELPKTEERIRKKISRHKGNNDVIRMGKYSSHFDEHDSRSWSFSIPQVERQLKMTDNTVCELYT
ncbi:unnamed protein product [Gordionus sp. m RMFG-2023]